MNTAPISEIGALPLITYSVANLVIVAGFLLLAFWIVRRVPLRRSGRIALSLFYCCSAFVHATLGIGNVFYNEPIRDTGAWWVTAVFHVIQAASLCVALAQYYILGSHDRRPPPPED